MYISWGGILAILGGFCTLCGAIAYILKITHPIKEWVKKVENSEADLAALKKEVESNNAILRQLDHANKMQFKFLINLADHMIAGNKEEEINKTRNEILKELMEG